MLKISPLIDSVAATSVGIVDDRALLDLAYEEDARAEVDMNVVMTGTGHFVEIQATAEGRPFSGSEMQDLLALAAGGIPRLTEKQRSVLPVKFSARARSAVSRIVPLGKTRRVSRADANSRFSLLRCTRAAPATCTSS